MEVSALKLPEEMWLHVLSFLPWGDKLSVRGTCRHFRDLLDKSRPLWRGFSVVLRHFALYNRRFWGSLSSRQVSCVLLCYGRRKQLRQLAKWLPAVTALGLSQWRDGDADELKLFSRLDRLAITSCCVPMKSVDFLRPLSKQLTQLSVCNIWLSCPPPVFLAAVSQLTRLTSLTFHHDGRLQVEAAAVSSTLSLLPVLRRLSWQMISYKTLPEDFFSPAHSADVLALSSLELLNYDATVTPEALRPLSRLQSLSIFHLYSVPGSTCHLRTWLMSLPQLSSLSIHGGHPLGVYVNFLPASLSSLMLNMDLEAEDLQVVARRLPGLQHFHLEPWSSGHSLIGLLPQLFPQLRTLRIRHRHVSDSDFLCLQSLPHLHTLEILDSYHKPKPENPDFILYEPSPKLLQLISELHRTTNNRVRVITGSAHKDPLTCKCA
ncbi:uncharacterized protein LOC143005669 [Genypterus blacodes]|uniref:uncharacterized protein LOC143005669 n=1 Tax=Genypterus blacodes TaxID=154954 RepID=UPI003F767867